MGIVMMHLRIAMILGLAAGLAGAAELKIASVPVNATNPPVIDVVLDPAGSDVSALQFDVEYDASVLDAAVEAGPAAVNAVKGVQSASLGSGKMRVVILGTNQNSMAAGPVALLKVTLKGSPEAGRSYPIKLSAVTGSTGKGEPVTITSRDGVVTIPGARKKGK